MNTRTLINWAGISGIVILVSNNIIQFKQTVLSAVTTGNSLEIIIIVLITFGVLVNSEFIGKFR